jgi:hypothetical protein
VTIDGWKERFARKGRECVTKESIVISVIIGSCLLAFDHAMTEMAPKYTDWAVNARKHPWNNLEALHQVYLLLRYPSLSLLYSTLISRTRRFADQERL